MADGLSDDVKLTQYGPEVDPPGSKYFDWNSYHGIGDRDNILGPGSVALTIPERQERFGTSGHSTGKTFEYGGHTYRDDDTAPESDKRIDVYQPGGAKKALERIDYGDHPFNDPILASPPRDYDFPAQQTYNPGTDEVQEAPKPQNTQSPLAVYRANFPQFADKPDDQVLTDMRNQLAPNVDQKKFNALAVIDNGYQAIQDLKDKLTPIQAYKKNFPQFADKPDDQVSSDAYDYLVQSKKIDPTITDKEDFKQVFNPKPGVVNAAFNFYRAAARQASATTHAASGQMYAGPQNASDFLYSVMDGVSKTPLYPSGIAPAGQQLKSIGQAADDWLAKNAGKPFEDYWTAFSGWLKSASGSEQGQAQKDLARAQQVKGAAGEAGRLAGGTAAGVATSLPIMGALGAESKAAAFVASLFLGSSKYAAAVQAHHDNAWIEGVQEMGTAGMFRYLINSPAGRLKSAFLNFAMNSGEDEVERMMKGEKTDWHSFTERASVDLLLGVLMGKSAEKGPYRSDITTEPITGIKLVSPTDILGPESGFVSRSFDVFQGVKRPEIPKIFSAEQAKAEERRLMSGRLTEAEVAKEEGDPAFLREKQRAILTGRQPQTRGYTPHPDLMPEEFLFDPHIENNGGIPPAAHEEITKAFHAQSNGDTEAAKDHTDKALSHLPPKEKTDVAKRSIVVVKSDAKGKAADAANQAYFGLTPVKRKRGEAGAMANPFGGRQAQEEGEIKRLYQAYNQLVSQTGLSSVKLIDLAKAMKVSAQELHAMIKQVSGANKELSGTNLRETDYPPSERAYWIPRPGNIGADKVRLYPGEEDFDSMLRNAGFRLEPAVRLGTQVVAGATHWDAAQTFSQVHEGSSLRQSGQGIHIRLPSERTEGLPATGVQSHLFEMGYKTPDGRFVTREQAAQLLRDTRQQTRERGEAGAVINPATLISEFFTQSWPGIKEKLSKLPLRNQQWIEVFHPELRGRGEEAAAISKYHTVEAQGSELLRDHIAKTLMVDAALSGTEPVLRRRAEFDKESDGTLKQWLVAHEEGRSTGNDTADWLFNFHDMAQKGMYEVENSLGIEYEPKETYIYHAVKREEQPRLLEWYDGLINSDPRFKHQRVMPTLREVFAAGFKLESNNPEDLFQLRLFQHNQAGRKIRTLDSFEEQGLAIDTKTKGLPEEIKAGDKARSPNGKNYYLEPGAAAVLKNAWDQQSLYNIKIIGPVFKGIRVLKGMGSTILTWSLFHPSHIARISLWNLASAWSRDLIKGRGPTRASGLQEAWGSIVKASGASGDKLLDYYHGKVGKDQLSTEDIVDNEHIKYMGLNFNLSEERRAQLEWVKNLSEMFPRWKTGIKGSDQAIKLGTQILSLEWVNKFVFGEIIPRQKIFAARIARDQLLRDHPEYTLPQNRSKFQAELSRKGREIEAKFGEMNMANLHWRKTAKELGISTLLSLGWQLSAIRVYAGGVKDLTDNVIHMRDVLRKANDPKKRDFFTDRLVFATNYTLGYMAMNAAISYFNGWSKGKDFQSRDLWFPVIGENPAGSQERWKRASPGEFPREFASIYQHIKNEGGQLHSIPYGIGDYAGNKLQPVLSSVKQAFVDQKNYFGQEIGDPLDNDHEWIWNKLGYIVSNSSLPITFKQALQPKAGEPAPQNVQEFAQDFLSADTLWGIMGFPRAPVWTGRSDTENLISSTFQRMHPEVKTAEHVATSTAYEQYREALAAKDQSGISTAVDKLRELGKSPKAIASVRRAAEKGVTATDYEFGTLDPEIQKRILDRMSQEERAHYQPLMKHAGSLSQ